VKDLRRQLLRGVAIAYPCGDERVQTLEVAVVEIRELRAIALRGLDERAVVLHQLRI